MARPRKMTGEIKRGSFYVDIDIYSKLLKLSHFQKCTFNDLIRDIFARYISDNAEVLTIIEQAEKQIAEIQNRQVI